MVPDGFKNGFRVYLSTDGSKRLDAIINGGIVPLRLPEGMKDFAVGYYDPDLKLVAVTGV